MYCTWWYTILKEWFEFFANHNKGLFKCLTAGRMGNWEIADVAISQSPRGRISPRVITVEKRVRTHLPVRAGCWKAPNERVAWEVCVLLYMRVHSRCVNTVYHYGCKTKPTSTSWQDFAWDCRRRHVLIGWQWGTRSRWTYSTYEGLLVDGNATR